MLSGLISALALFTVFPQQSSTLPKLPQVQTAMMCMKSGEQTSGMNKICYYDCMGSTKAITVRATDLCPLTIND
ncbi:hypothetical protein Rleg9DRAFT_3677 [Rhizobium leguminosarum bv. trifolii WSM597]|uniref:Uncharacterized protein n=1 Tax=Rhizobium leguminosarum bv. trifolii WSM597 TaxID=754764 RepID=J0H4B8_RHILT|nr:hypothetical protein Rleg9DRAFT_3677 [Rhizobium leguminosarum bv. trifolii WSM597]